MAGDAELNCLDSIADYVDTDIQFLIQFMEAAEPLMSFILPYIAHTILSPSPGSPLERVKILIDNPVFYIHLVFLRLLFPAFLFEGKDMTQPLKKMYKACLSELGEDKKTLRFSLSKEQAVSEVEKQ